MDDICTLASRLLSRTELADIDTCIQGAALKQSGDKSAILASIDGLSLSKNTYAPFLALTKVLSTIPGPWPVFLLQQSCVKAWKALPEEAKAGSAASEVQQVVHRCLELCKQSYTSLLDLLDSRSNNAAIIDPETGRWLPHDKLVAGIRRFALPFQNPAGKRKPVVAVSLPNGPLLAITVLAVTTYYTTAPVAHGSGVGAEQTKSDVLQSKSDMILAHAADVDRLGLRDSWLREAGIAVLLVELSADMELIVTDLNGRVTALTTPDPVPNDADDTGILLFTSGTSGTKKLVPVPVHSMVCGIAMVIDSWGLSPSMRCLNQMPLNQ